MPRAYGEAVVVNDHGDVQPNVQVDVIDPATGLRVAATLFADATSSTTLTLPLTTGANGRRLFFMTTGGLYVQRPIISGVPRPDLDAELPVWDPTATGSAGPHTHAETDITNLSADLAGKSATGHSHTQQWQAGATFSAPVAGDLATAPRPSGTITPTAFYARRTGGTGATVDVKKNGTSLLTGTVSITAAATWTAGTLVASPSLAAGDVIEFDVVTIAGGPSEIVLSLDGTRTIT